MVVNGPAVFSSIRVVLLAVVCFAGITNAAASELAPVNQTVVHEAEIKTPESLVDFWLSVPSVGNVDWSFAFISTEKSSALRANQRAALIQELELASQHNTKIAAVTAQLQAWKATLAGIRNFRVPGRWDPAHLISFPGRIPPLRAITAAGYCIAVPWVEVWDTRGVHRVKWYPGMRVSTLLQTKDLDVFPRTSWVHLVMPWGEQEKLGVAPWNYQDRPVIAGTRIVAPLKSEDYPAQWLNRSLPDFLAHSVTGDSCWRGKLQPTEVPVQ